MADLVDPREGPSEFDEMASSDLGRDPGPEPHPTVEHKPANPPHGKQVDPRKEHPEFDGIR